MSIINDVNIENEAAAYDKEYEDDQEKFITIKV